MLTEQQLAVLRSEPGSNRVAKAMALSGVTQVIVAKALGLTQVVSRPRTAPTIVLGGGRSLPQPAQGYAAAGAGLRRRRRRATPPRTTGYVQDRHTTGEELTEAATTKRDLGGKATGAWTRSTAAWIRSRPASPA